MKLKTTIDYKLGYKEKLPLEITYYYKDACKGDYYTPPTDAEVYIEKIMLCDFNIVEVADDSFIEDLENKIYKIHED